MNYQAPAKYASSYFSTLHRLLRDMAVTTADKMELQCDSGIDRFVNICRAIDSRGGRLFFVGNGGSAAIASHMTTDYFKNGNFTTIGLYDPAVLTCLSNDYGYENAFSTQIERHAEAGDLLIAISSSGRSKNILNAVAAAKKKSAVVITLSGFTADNPLRELGDLNFYIASSEYGFVELAHCSLCHCVLDAHMSTPTDAIEPSRSR